MLGMWKGAIFSRLVAFALGLAVSAAALGARPAPTLPPKAPSAGEALRLTLLGDCTIGEQHRWRGYGFSFTGRVEALGMDYPFSALVDVLSADDMTLANCEGVFTTSKSYRSRSRSISAPPEWAQVLALGSVEVVNRVNNHWLDYGRAGAQDTMDALDGVGIQHFGDGALCLYQVKGVTIGLTGYTYPHTGTLPRVEADIATLRQAGCDLVIVSMHWGQEESAQLTGLQRTLGPAIIDAGADVVYGHGPHVLQPIEMYKGKPIFYSLANFVFGANANPKDPDTAVLCLEYALEGEGPRLQSLTAIPCSMHSQKDYRPYEYTGEKDRLRVFGKLLFSKGAPMDSALPESFRETGMASFLQE